MQHDSLHNLLRALFGAAVARVAGTPAESTDPMVRVAGDPQFGDYQCNAAMSLAKTLKAKPRDVAAKIVVEAQPALAQIAEPLEIAGPGFINIRLKPEFLAGHLGEIPAPKTDTAHECDRVGLTPVEHPLRVVVEYSQPNIAKQMHVGHLRSTIIGDVFARVLAFEGHEVIRQNHIGDWGTQFGTVIHGLWHICMARARRQPDYLKNMLARLENKGDPDDLQAAFFEIKTQQDEDYRLDDTGEPTGAGKGKRVFLPFLERIHKDQSVSLDEIELSYRYATRLQDVSRTLAEDPYLGLSQKVTLWLQLGEEQERMAWEYCRAATLDYCQGLYSRLGVLLSPDDVRGESFYNDRLAGIITELREKLSEIRIPNASEGPPPSAPRDEPIRTPNASEGPQASAPRAQHSPIRAAVRDDQGAVVVYLYDDAGQPLFKNADGEILGMIVQKSDGAYLYATTDLAAIRFRLKELTFTKTVDGQQILLGVGAQRIIYVTDARQKLHFRMFFAAAQALGWITDQQVDHVTFGSVLGADRKPLKTRAGGTIKLSELLDEAERRADELLQSRIKIGEPQDPEAESAGPVFSENERREVSRRVGVAALKYADLRNDRNADYVFDWDKMLALQGNTAPYMMYAYARIRSIYRKAAKTIGATDVRVPVATPVVAQAADTIGATDVYAPGVALTLAEPTERALAIRLARLRETIDVVAADLTPHVLCTYLYDLAGDFMRFYENCPVLQAPDEATRLGRLRLCDLTARALKLGLGLLGIETIERM